MLSFSDNKVFRFAMTTERRCRHCENKVYGRSDRKYCSSNCRKRYSEYTQNSHSSKSKRDRNYRFFDRCSRLSEYYFSRPPFERLGLMKEWIEIARDGKDKTLRDILSNRFLINQTDYGNPYPGKRGRYFGNISSECEEYCKRFWKASAHDVVYNIAAQP